MKKLSIVTINYNNRDGLIDTLKSIEDQSFSDFELIVIDPGSTDGSIDIIDDFNHLITTPIIGQDHGIYNAMNIGIENSSGLFVHILNSGDTYFSSNCLSLIDFSTSADYICFPVQKFSPKKYLWTPQVLFEEDFVNVAHPGLIVRRTVYNNNLYSEDFKIASDSIFIYRNVKPSKSDLNLDCSVLMQVDGISSTISFSHELEKQALFWCHGYRSKKRLLLSLISFIVFLRRVFFLVIKNIIKFIGLLK